MRIKSLSFRNVGPFGAQGIRLDGFTPGLNVISETNEFGKSTVLKALELVLFKPFSSADKQIKALRTAHCEDGPEGEITFASDGRNYRFTKRFLKSKGARLQDTDTGEDLAVDRAAEEALATLLRSDKFDGGPSGLLWVRQGMSMEGVADNGQVASRLEGELGTLVGGERARDYLTRVETELAKVLTPRGQEKKGGPLKNVREGLEATELELSEAKRRHDMTTAIGVELNQVTDEIHRLSGEVDDENLTQQINMTREAMVEARRFADSLALLEAKQSQAVATATRVQDRQAVHIASLVSYNDADERLKTAQALHQSETVKLNELTARRVEARKSIAEIETRQDSFTKARAHRDVVARQTQRLEILQQELQHLRARLDQLNVLRDEQESLTDQISDLPLLTRTDVEALRACESELRHYDAELSAISTRLYLDISKIGQGKITLDGQALQTGAVELSGGQSLVIEGIGEIRSDDSRLRQTTQNRDRARETYHEVLERFGVANPGEASKFADQRQNLEAERKRVTADMTRLAPEGRKAIEQTFNTTEAEVRELVDSLENEPAEFNEADDNAIFEQLRTERAKLEIIEESLTDTRQSLAKSETEQARLRERLDGLNLSTDDAERQAQTDNLAGEKLKADSDVRALSAEVEAFKSRAPERSLEMLTARLTRLEQVAGQSRERLESLKTKSAALQARRDAAFEGADAEAVVGGLERRLEAQRDELARQVRAKDVRILLRDTLIETQSRLREAYTAPVTQELAPLLSRVIPGAQAALGESLGVDTISRDGKVEKIGQLSGGTREQFAILTRLAYARLLARSGSSAPVILDDALVYADDARRDAMFDVLGLVSSGELPIQIIYLSCHANATARLGGTRIMPQAW